MQRKKRVTIRDVAARAGVSPTAVSFAFNSPKQLNHNTCQRIRQIATDMNYQAHPVARTLAVGKTNIIGLVVPTGLHFALCDAFFRLFIGQFGDLCDRSNRHLLLLSVGENTSLSLDTIAADGFLVVGIHGEHAFSRVVEQTSCPVVLLDSEPSIEAPVLNLDDFQGAYKAARHLLDRGHRKIAVSAMQFTPTRLKSVPFHSRICGYRQAVCDAGLPSDLLQVVYTEELNFLTDDTRPFEDLWSLATRPTAVLCVSDARALQILRAAKERGLSIPGDLAIVGFDNIPDAEVTEPGITTVDQDIRGRCQRAFELLHALILEPREVALDRSTYIDPVHLIVRGSS